MKKLFIFLAICICTISLKSQNWPIDEKTGKILYTDVINTDSIKKEEVYSIIKEWIAKTFVDSREVIELDDKESGKILGTGLFKVHLPSGAFAGYVRYDIYFIIKDNRFKYEISNFIHDTYGTLQGIGSGGDLLNEKPVCGYFFLTKRYWAGIKEETYINTNSLIIDLQTFVMSSLNKKDDW